MKKLWILLAITLLVTLLAPAAGAITDTPEDGAYIVKLKETEADTVRLFSNIDAYEISEDAGLYRVDSYEDVKKLGAAVEYYEPDAVATLFALTNDKYSSYQWNLESISIDAAWDKGYNGEGVRVAVIDSGVNSMHEDFDGTIFEKGTNMVDGSRDVTDENGHGTFVCGTLAAIANNGIGIAGLCDDVVIIPIKCFGDGPDTNTSYIISAIYEAVDVYDCDIINLSLGTKTNLTSMRKAIDYADSKGVIIISAVGNDGTSEIYYPSAYSNVIGVGAVDSEGKVASFSQKNSSVFVTAPGSALVGLGYEDTDSYVPKARGNGTSYASPHIVAAAVFLKEFNSSANVEDFKQILMESVTDAGAAGYDTSYGYGILDIGSFVTAMEEYEFSSIGEIFPDVDGHWAEESIALCVSSGYFNGVSSSSFEPEALMNRAMFVTVLSRMSGESISGYPNSFLDVPDGQYFTQACGWGAAAGVVQGVSSEEFGPYGQVTREQMAVFLYRFAKAYDLTGDVSDTTALNAFDDAASVSEYAREAMTWATNHGLITGRTSTTLVPGGDAKRCEVAAIISRFVSEFMA